MILGMHERIKQCREEKKISQAKLSRILNISPSTVSSYESGQISPSIDVIAKMSYIFKVSTDYLLGVESGRHIIVQNITDSQYETIKSVVDLMVTEFNISALKKEKS